MPSVSPLNHVSSRAYQQVQQPGPWNPQESFLPCHTYPQPLPLQYVPRPPSPAICSSQAGAEGYVLAHVMALCPAPQEASGGGRGAFLSQPLAFDKLPTHGHAHSTSLPVRLHEDSAALKSAWDAQVAQLSQEAVSKDLQVQALREDEAKLKAQLARAQQDVDR